MGIAIGQTVAERYLVRDYADELTALYRGGILKFMQAANNRNSYREGCRYLRRMIKIGARTEAEALIADLQYPAGVAGGIE